MPRQSEAWKLWTIGLEDWEHQRLDDAVAAFRQAIAIATPDDPGLVEYHQSLGHVLDDLGETGKAQAALEAALDLASERHRDRASIEVVLARCFLAEHFLRVLRFQRAIDVMEPSQSGGAVVDALVCHVRARAFHGLGQLDRARREAERAIELASPQQRERFERDLRPLLN